MSCPATEHIIFDWNGTLIDDIAVAVAGVNKVRAHQRLPAIDARIYRDQFVFPIQTFYRDLGVDLEALSFAQLSKMYLELFNDGIKRCVLHDGATEVMSWARASGIKISILSASQRDTLRANLEHLDLLGSVDNVFGLDGSDASGKLALAESLDAHLGHPGQAALMIGDTDHDVEVARACGWRVACVAHGHQSSERLARVTETVFPDLRALFRTLFPQSVFA